MSLQREYIHSKVVYDENDFKDYVEVPSWYTVAPLDTSIEDEADKGQRVSEQVQTNQLVVFVEFHSIFDSLCHS